MTGKRSISILFALLILLLSGCQALGLVEPTATPVPPTPTPLPPTELTICMSSEPETLYPYALSSQSAADILQAIYEGPFEQVDGQTVPVILTSMPDYNSGTAVFNAVTVQAGDQVINIYGELISLQTGDQVFPSGCTNSSCAVTWDGLAPIQMDQPNATFQLRADLTWSDGQALTAADSVYSFELASANATPIDKTYINRTASYIALDDTTLQWVGLPGLATDEFENYFWMPLPQHVWGAATAADLLVSEQAARSPLGWGPYTLDEWVSGSHIRLKKNGLYFRANEDLPKYDYMSIKFIPQGDTTQALDGTCDIVAGDVLDINQVNLDEDILSASDYQLRVSDSTEFEFLAFGITPASYDDSYYPYGADRPDIFGDVNTRRAIALCIDRQAILDELTAGLVDTSNSYLSNDNELLSEFSLPQYAYDPEQGKALLDTIGWKDYDLDPATPLTMIATNTTVPFGTNFSINLYTSQSEMRSLIGEKIVSDLADCGIEVVITQLPIQELYQPGPDGVIFGRSFDLALLSMDMSIDLNCGLFTSAEIPTEANYWLGTATGGSNFMGYQNTVYDETCAAAQSTGLDAGSFRLNAQNTLRILAEELPVIPFYHHPEFTLVKKELNLGVDLDTIQGILFSVETLVPNVQ